MFMKSEIDIFLVNFVYIINRNITYNEALLLKHEYRFFPIPQRSACCLS